jgi:hypothetical protein
MDEAEIPESLYNVSPPVPESNINTVGVGLEVISNSNVNPKAISKFLGVLYNSSIENVFLRKVEEEKGNSFSQFPLSKGTIAYMKRKEPVFSFNTVDKIKNLIGSIMAFLSTVMIVI